MIKKKVCLLGAFAVGKTSLVKRFVDNMFSDKYLTTVGVKIDKKMVEHNGEEVTLLLWDIQGDEGIKSLPVSYLRGATGCILVIDGTRADTLETALVIEEKMRATLGDLPVVCALNKADLEDEWVLSTEGLEDLKSRGWEVIKTSAKDGLGVEDIFRELTNAMLSKEQPS
jgi:small GTP-binding protein